MTPDEAHRIVSEPAFDTDGAAVQLGVSRRTIERLRATGALKYRRVGSRIEHTETHVAEYLLSTERDQSPPPLALTSRSRRPRRAA